MMPVLDDLLYRLRSLFQHKSVEHELDEELRFHVEQSVERYVNAGLSREEALRRARLEFGGIERAKEECRDARGVRLLETIWQDTRYAARMLRKSPAFALVVVLTLALGIAANATIFAMVSRFVLHTAPVGDPASLLSLHTTDHSECCNSFSWPLFTDVRDNAHSFSGVAGFYELLPASIS